MESTNTSNKPLSAPLWRRFCALGYDLFLLGALSMCYGAAVIGASMIMFAPPENNDYQPLVNGGLFQLGWLACLCAFYAFFWLRGGQTAGMRAWEIRLIAEPPYPITIYAVIIRLLVGIPSFALLGFGYVWRFFDKNQQCLHDKLSHTHVIIQRRPKRKKK